MRAGFPVYQLTKAVSCIVPSCHLKTGDSDAKAGQDNFLFHGQSHCPGRFQIGWFGIDSKENTGFKKAAVAGGRSVGDGLCGNGRGREGRGTTVVVMVGLMNSILMIIHMVIHGVLCHDVIQRGMRRIMGIIMVGIM